MTRENDQAAPALPSATIVLLRNSDRGPELLMVKRRAGDAFGKRYTFPGGVVDDDESRARPFCEGISADAANTALHLKDGGLDYYSAAIRELFEETGILMARDSNGDWLNDDCEIQTFRDELNNGQLSWSALLRRHNLRAACDALHYFSFWVTPLALPKRWSARFFLAEAPPRQEACHDGVDHARTHLR